MGEHWYKPITDYIREVGVELVEFELTIRKVVQRARQIEPPLEYPPGVIAFEVERHHGIFSEIYEPGRPMAAFVTHWPRYVFDPFAKTMHELPAQRVPEATIEDMSEVAGRFVDFWIRLHPLEDGRYHYDLGRGGAPGMVANVDELIAIAQAEVDDIEFEPDEWDGLLPIEDAKELFDSVKAAAKEAAAEKVLEAWDEMEDEYE